MMKKLQFGVPALSMLTLILTGAMNLSAVEYKLTGNQRGLVDNLRTDLQPGFKMSCRVKFDRFAEDLGNEYILQKSVGSNGTGSYILRLNSKGEGRSFSFFMNPGNGIEPRVSSAPVKVEFGKWYDLAAGWDGKEQWITVDGKTSKIKRTGPATPIRNNGRIIIGSIYGTVADPEIAGGSSVGSGDATMYPGFKFYGEAIFSKMPPPESDTIIVRKDNEYMVRYDSRKGREAFQMFTYIDNGWEPRLIIPAKIEVGKRYLFGGGWSGKKMFFEIDGYGSFDMHRFGVCKPFGKPLELGTKDIVRVENFVIRSEPKALIGFGQFRTSGMLPRMGEVQEVKGTMVNLGTELKTGATLTIAATNGAKVTPEKLEFDSLAAYAEKDFKFTLDPGKARETEITCTFSAPRMDAVIAKYDTYFLPKKDPDLSAKAWNPPVKPTKTYYIDAIGGSDANDGLSQEKPWRTLGKAKGLTLGPGERLLLRRGSVFNEMLEVTGKGKAGNWAEIGAYGKGMRPTIRRNRMLDQRCALIVAPQYLVIHDLIVCNAGDGLCVYCAKGDSNNLLIERILAHHIEGKYRHNSHGIPEWQDIVGPKPTEFGSRSCGMHFSGYSRNTVMRDCESYQCSSGFAVSGVDSFVTRMFCHDNFAHNTSPHPYNTAKRAWMTDCIFDASGWHASAGTMGVMLWNNRDYIIRGCYFLNQPDSGSADQGGIDFEADGENCLVEECTFRNNAGCPIEILGLRTPQTRNVWIRRNRFYRNNWAHKNGPSVIQVWGSIRESKAVCCSNGIIEDNGYVTLPDVPFYINNTVTTNDWKLINNREFAFEKELNAAYPFVEPPEVRVTDEIWTDNPDKVALEGVASDNAQVAWEQIEGRDGVRFLRADEQGTFADFPGVGDYRVMLKADNGRYWRSARTAVHVLPKGSKTCRVWNFAKNLDSEGWNAENTGMAFAFIPGRTAVWSTSSHPVKYVCGDYFVIAIKDSGKAAIVTPDTRNVGAAFTKNGANTMRIKMQNRTNSKKMRLYYTHGNTPAWSEKDSVAFDVRPQDLDDSVYSVKLPSTDTIRQIKIAFSADGEPITGTVRIDYIWLGNVK